MWRGDNKRTLAHGLQSFEACMFSCKGSHPETFFYHRGGLLSVPLLPFLLRILFMLLKCQDFGNIEPGEWKTTGKVALAGGGVR